MLQTLVYIYPARYWGRTKYITNSIHADDYCVIESITDLGFQSG